MVKRLGMLSLPIAAALVVAAVTFLANPALASIMINR